MIPFAPLSASGGATAPSAPGSAAYTAVPSFESLRSGVFVTMKQTPGMVYGIVEFNVPLDTV